MAKTLLPDGSTRHNGGAYEVIVGPDGSIHVKPGDSISKYSMAIHGDFDHLYEYRHRRHKPNGPITDSDLKELPDINLINAGETLYHMPSRDTSSIPTPVDPDPLDPKPGQAVEFPRQKLNGLRFSPSVTVPILGYGFIKAGQSWLAHDGRRTILNIDTGSATVLFLLEKPAGADNYKIFIQNVEAFKLDVRNWLVDELGQRLQPLKQIIEAEVALVLGMVSCLNFPAFMIITGVSTLEWVINNREWLGKVNDAIYVTCEVHSFMSANAPTLYKKIIEGLFHGLWDAAPGIIGNIPAAIANDHKLVGSGTGVILGKIAFSGATSRIAVAKLIFSLLFTIVMKAVQAAPGAIVITAQEKAQYAEEIVANLRGQGVTISEAEANAIIDEVLANPDALREKLESLHRAFAAIQ